MLLQKVLNILTTMPMKSQKMVMSQVDFTKNTPSEVYHKIVNTMLTVCKSAQHREILQLCNSVTAKDDDVIKAFGSSSREIMKPISFSDDQIEYIKSHVYRNREGDFRLIPFNKSSTPDDIPLEGLKADEEIISAVLTTIRENPNGSTESFDGLKELRKQPYDPPYDSIYKHLAPNIGRINIISSFKDNDPHGFFIRDNKMYRNVCNQMIDIDQEFVNSKSLDRAMFLLFLVGGGTLDGWEALYKIIHFIVKVPNSSTGYILYLNDFDAGGNGKSKLVNMLQHMFGDSFSAFSTQQVRFTMSLMGKRLVSISEYEDSGDNKALQGILKSMTGRDKFQYEGKGTNPVVAETYQNFVISSNRYIHFEDYGIKRRLQNFHCSNLLHLCLNRYTKTPDYLNPLFGSIYNGESHKIIKEMAHSLLDYIMKDDYVYSIPIRPQTIVLGSLRNPVLRSLFSANVMFDGFIRSVGDGSSIDLFRLSSEAKPEQLNYAASTIQSWLSDIEFEVARDATYMTCNLPEEVLISRLDTRLTQLDESSRQLKARRKVELENCKFNQFESIQLFNKFLGETVESYNIPTTLSDHILTVGD